MYINNSGHMTKMATFPYMVKPVLKFSSLVDQFHVALWTRVLQFLHKLDPVMISTYFTARSCLLVYIPDLR